MPRTLLALAAAFALPAIALARPHTSGGTAHFTSPTTFVGSGQATHLGNYTESGTVAFTPTSDPAVLEVSGTTDYTSSSGDVLHANVSGQLNLATGQITATLTYDGGSGRFDNATGSGLLTAQMQPDGTIAASVSGNVDY